MFTARSILPLSSTRSAETADGDFFVLYAGPLSELHGPPEGRCRAQHRHRIHSLPPCAKPALVYFAHSISKPLSKLSKEAELIQSFQLAEPIRLKSRVHEVNTLIRSDVGHEGRHPGRSPSSCRRRW